MTAFSTLNALYDWLALGQWGFSPAAWAAFCLAVFLAGFSKAGMPGATIMVVPIMAMIVPPKISVGLILPIYMTGDLFSVLNYRRFAVKRCCFPYLLFVALGVGCASFIAGAVDDRTFGVIIGGTIITLILLSAGTDFVKHRLLKERDEAGMRPPGLRVSVPFGLAAGLFSALANAAGPITSIYVIVTRLDKYQMLGTFSVCSFFQNWFKVPLFLSLGMITPGTLKLDLLAAPMVVAGGVLGVMFARRVPQALFKNLVLLLAFVAAAKLVMN
ncbi:MAG: sulfite exporter TauE/SafE family protein [Synergistaceae bacterium]|jgi:uncharacterized membrane protein YfcA|nr:sulfite exporter TauE/SafE family protein [Synergistaceae bacterium]